MSENNALMKPSEINLETAELIDIELPTPPQTDWSAIWALFGWSLVGLLVVLLVWLLIRNSRAQQKMLLLKPIWLKWQINKQLKSLTSKTDSTQASEAELFSYYQLSKQLFDVCLKQPALTAENLQQLNQLLKQSELMAFSSQTTEVMQLIACYQQSLVLLQKSIRWPEMLSAVLTGLIGRVKARFSR